MSVAEEWVVLELGPRADGEDPDLVRRSIRSTVKDADVFIPAAVTTVGEDKVVRYLVEGYAFIRRTQPDQTYFRLEGTKYVNAVLRGTGRKVACVGPIEINKLRAQVRRESEQGIEVGDTVMIMSGAYRQITAVVHEDIPEHETVQVFIRLRSKEALVSLPRNFLRLLTKSTKATTEDRTTAWVDWYQGIRPAVVWTPEQMRKLSSGYGEWRRLHEWVGEGKRLLALTRTLERPALKFEPLLETHKKWQIVTGFLSSIRPVDKFNWAMHKVLDPTPLKVAHDSLHRVSEWETVGRPLARFVEVFYTTLDKARLEARYVEWLWMKDMMDRIRAIGEDIDVLESEMDISTDVDMNDDATAGLRLSSYDNVLVDGLNLACRCAYAPGLATLKDPQGRSIGVFVGFLNSIASFQRRYPTAQIYICWDGSSQRRRSTFQDYKGQRGDLPVSREQVEWLRGTLPLLGVEQAWNPDEEADDVIATLVKGNLAGQRNLIYSTDRDMLQLVSWKDTFLTPAVGKAKETFYDPDAVEAKWGVEPGKISTLRALIGDTSDNIPGIGIVPKHVLAKLVQVYGSIERIYTSKLTGLSKLQYERIKASEALVRRNVELMTLRTDLMLTTVAAAPDRMAVETRLQEACLKPDTILTAFFERPVGFVKTGELS